ncbi:MAG: hypothetical protein VX413_07265 [Verrucomicrobiota bacterium]|nr:hypothetical protein [Verrucomicrobiota bacterium]
MAPETTDKPADLNCIMGDNKTSKHRAGTFDAVAYRRTKLAERLTRRPLPRNSTAWFNHQLP